MESVVFVPEMESMELLGTKQPIFVPEMTASGFPD